MNKIKGLAGGVASGPCMGRSQSAHTLNYYYTGMPRFTLGLR